MSLISESTLIPWLADSAYALASSADCAAAACAACAFLSAEPSAGLCAVPLSPTITFFAFVAVCAAAFACASEPSVSLNSSTAAFASRISFSALPSAGDCAFPVPKTSCLTASMSVLVLSMLSFAASTASLSALTVALSAATAACAASAAACAVSAAVFAA